MCEVCGVNNHGVDILVGVAKCRFRRGEVDVESRGDSCFRVRTLSRMENTPRMRPNAGFRTKGSVPGFLIEPRREPPS